MDYAILLVIVASVAVGVVSAVITTWSMRARLFSLQDTVGRMEGALLRETKARAAAERWKRPSADEELLKLAQTQPAPNRRYNFWERAVAMKHKG